ncbi:amidase [Anatilimnocola sp. NA78]|uniref:amidase n=1 Tax=Anatilimnocola sp. NA78 TaxID=3415683 RepID=UPI003CE598C1
MTSWTDLSEWSASEIARRITARQISAREVCRAYVGRCEAVNPQINAFTWKRFEQAISEATVIDEQIARGESVGPLAGVPITIKDCFHVAGSTACIGLSSLKDEVSPETGVLVKRLQRAGAVILGKTNVPQLMILHECDNPVFGRTNNPWNLERTCGGSSGGEAAIIAAGGSPLGLGNDLGGSIRIPAHFSGIAGLKPTSRRLTNAGIRSNFRGFEAIIGAAGPLARHVEDLDLALRVLADHSDGESLHEIEPWPLHDFREVDLSKLRIGIWLEDGYLPVSPAVKRAVKEAAAVLTKAGATVDEFRFAHGAEILDLYVALIEADGCADLRRIASDSKLDWRVSRMMMAGGLNRLSRAVLVTGMRLLGQKYLAQLFQEARPRSTDEFWKLVRRRDELQASFRDRFAAGRFDAILSPPHALPAPQHGKPIDLVSAASWAFLPNLLGWPAGVVLATTVQADEQDSRPASRDQVLKQAKAVDAGSGGLPSGAQVFAPPWREDTVLAVMAAIERGVPRLRATI